ncbi:putative SNF2 family helicase [Aspergillus alliaceus]|uniref:putative SNF2 family helicase n=1 Tax=Petromyces alliaceus TaxID=209559 RepID=UPI0012A76FA9|nr:uncharacterized protein BDW43DRAFT_309144 [Aspergillus alliaceus]KAB8235814.1 hypothetical protein BDW43DRAFT_309144 [Aspergillus alliaceus]
MKSQMTMKKQTGSLVVMEICLVLNWRRFPEIVKGWIEENSDMKKAIFTQFLGFVRLHGYSAGTRRGVPLVAWRDSRVEEIRILVASLKAGGIRLDMSMANKCILVDLWWNEAIKDQAFCRLYRIGQSKDVEFVKIIMKVSIDEYLLRMQTHTTVEITSTLGDEVLKNRDSVVELQELFGGIRN